MFGRRELVVVVVLLVTITLWSTPADAGRAPGPDTDLSVDEGVRDGWEDVDEDDEDEEEDVDDDEEGDDEDDEDRAGDASEVDDDEDIERDDEETGRDGEDTEQDDDGEGDDEDAEREDDDRVEGASEGDDEDGEDDSEADGARADEEGEEEDEDMDDEEESEDEGEKGDDEGENEDEEEGDEGEEEDDEDEEEADGRKDDDSDESNTEQEDDDEESSKEENEKSTREKNEESSREVDVDIEDSSRDDETAGDDVRQGERDEPARTMRVSADGRGNDPSAALAGFDVRDVFDSPSGGRNRPPGEPQPVQYGSLALCGVVIARRSSVMGPVAPDFVALTARMMADLARQWAPDERWVLGGTYYSRYDDPDPLEHERRNSLYERIRRSPGVCLSRLAEEFDMTLSTARHHLDVLEWEGLVEDRTVLGKRRFVPLGAGDTEHLALLNDDATARVLRALDRRGPSDVSALAEDIDRDPSTVSHHLQRLESAALVERRREGRSVVSHLTPTAEELLRGSIPTARRSGHYDASD